MADGVWVHQPAWLIIRSEHNPKRSISFYWLERGGRWALSPLTSQADHQKLNVIKKSAFHFFGRRGVADGVQVHQLAQSIIRSERNPKISILFFGWRAVVDGVRVHWPAQPIIRSWTERSRNLDRSFRNICIIPSFPTREQHAHSVQNARSRFTKLNQ